MNYKNSTAFVFFISNIIGMHLAKTVNNMHNFDIRPFAQCAVHLFFPKTSLYFSSLNLLTTKESILHGNPEITKWTIYNHANFKAKELETLSKNNLCDVQIIMPEDDKLFKDDFMGLRYYIHEQRPFSYRSNVYY